MSEKLTDSDQHKAICQLVRIIDGLELDLDAVLTRDQLAKWVTLFQQCTGEESNWKDFK